MKMYSGIKGLKLEMILKVEGTITHTNAKHADKKTGMITVTSLDMDQMNKDPESMKKAIMAGAAGPASLARHKIKGVKSQEIGKTVSIRFK